MNMLASSPHNNNHNRIVLLFDLDCFYAQCERVRLGLPEDVSLALLQWNSVLAVTYPARKFGIQRGDSWDEVAEKSQNTCWAIHLQVLDLVNTSTTTRSTTSTTDSEPTTTTKTVLQNPYAKNQTSTSTSSTTNQDKSEEITTTSSTTNPHPHPHPPQEEDRGASSEPPDIQNPYAKNRTSTSSTTTNQDASEETTSSSITTNHHPPQEEDSRGVPSEPPEESVVANVEDAFDQIYKLSREEQLECQKRERGVRRLHNEGKACLERYRLASMRIFSVVLESLTKHLSGKDNFVLERASIDEFYLDITTYCYQLSTLTAQDLTHTTVVVGETKHADVSYSADAAVATTTCSDLQSLALQRACEVSHWVRQGVFETLGFTMSAGICTNKMMAKLAASYGKPKGQAVLYPRHFPSLLGTTKIRKVRHFGGKLGKNVLKVLQEQSSNPTSFDSDSATMGELQQIPLPVLQKHFSEETANFVFEACRGVDGEAVKETTGALVKSITAFKSFPATSNLKEIQSWLFLLANEVTSRVARDSARNHRYPKTCTVNFTYYNTDSGKRPQGVTSTRSFRNSKSIRLNFPHEKSSNKVQDLVHQSMQKLHPVLKEHALRGVGLSASSFENRGCPPEGVKGITTFFAKKEEETMDGNPTTKERVEPITSNVSVKSFTNRKRKLDIEQFFSQPQTEAVNANVISASKSEPDHPPPSHLQQSNEDNKSNHEDDVQETSRQQLPVPKRTNNAPPCSSSSSLKEADEDQELAKRLQASFDRENYVLSAANRFRPSGGGPNSSSNSKAKTNPSRTVRRIDTFFGKK